MARIGIDASPLKKLHGGISYYIFYILDELIKLRPTDTFFLFSPTVQGDIERFTQYQNVTLVSLPAFFLGHSLWSQTILSYACWLKSIDVFWGTTQSIPFIKKTKMRTVFTLYDFVHLICPETTSFVKKFYFRFFLDRMLRKADAILPISKGTGSKLRQFHGLESTDILYPPLKPLLRFQAMPHSFLQSYSLEFKNYLVVVGTLEPRKNFRELVEYYTKVLSQNDIKNILPLVIIGGGGWKNKQILETLNQARQQYPTHILLLGYVTDTELALFLSGARYYLMLSKYEGYGMPLAEARMCCTGVICLDQVEMREAAENDGIFLNSANWANELSPYLLRGTEIKSPATPTYESNQEKARKLSTIIDRF